MTKPLKPIKVRVETRHVLPAPCHRCGKHIGLEDHAGFIDDHLHCWSCHNYLLYSFIANVNMKKPIIPKSELIYFIFLSIGLVWIFFFALMELINPFYFDNFLRIGFTIMALPYFRLFLRVLFKGPKGSDSYFSKLQDSTHYDGLWRSSYSVSNFSLFQMIVVLFINFQIAITLTFIAPFKHLSNIGIRVYNRLLAKKIRVKFKGFYLEEKTTDRRETLYHMSISGDLETYKESHFQYLNKRTKINAKDLIIDNQSKVPIAKNVYINDAFDQLLDFTLWIDYKDQSFKYGFILEKAS